MNASFEAMLFQVGRHDRYVCVANNICKTWFLKICNILLAIFCVSCHCSVEKLSVSHEIESGFFMNLCFIFKGS